MELNWKKGVALTVGAWLFFTLAIALARTAEGNLLPIPILLLFQNGVGLLIVLPVIVKNGFHVEKPHYKLLILRALAGYLSFAFIYLATQKISLVNTILLSNCTPFFIPLIIWVWRGIRIEWQLWVGIILGFIGITLILKPTGEWHVGGGLFALAAALCFAVSMIAQRRLIKKEQTASILFSYFLFGLIVSLPLAIYYWQALTFKDWGTLMGIGVLATIGQWLFLTAFRFAKPSFLGPFNYSGVVWAFALEWIVWHHFPDWLALVGICIVAAGAVLVIRAAADSH